MNTTHIAMPPPPKKRAVGKKTCIFLGLGFFLCAALFYCFYTLQGFHDGRILDSSLEIIAGRGGMLDLTVKEGQHVAPGDYLGSVEGAALRERIAKMEQQLAPLEMALPPEYAGYVGHSGYKEATGASDEALRKAEEREKNAREALNTASQEEARAQFAARKAQQQFYRGAIQQAELAAVQEAALASKVQADEALRLFTEISLARAGIEKERNRVRLIQEESGLAAIPADVRIKEYEALKAQLNNLRKIYESSVFFAPYAAVITSVQAENNSLVKQAQPIITLRPTHGYVAMATGRVSGLVSAALRQGDRCAVVIPSYSDAPLQGTISSLIPLEGGWRSVLPADMRWVAVYIEVPIIREGPPLPSDASVTVRFKAPEKTDNAKTDNAKPDNDKTDNDKTEDGKIGPGSMGNNAGEAGEGVSRL